jgi:hypothetical protein
MSQTVVALSPIPSSLPTSSASGPVTATPTATSASIRSRATVVPTRVGSVFQIGRPSGTS